MPSGNVGRIRRDHVMMNTKSPGVRSGTATRRLRNRGYNLDSGAPATLTRSAKREGASPRNGASKKKRRPFMAASGISTDHLLSEYILASRNTSLLTSTVVSCDMSLSGFPSSSNYRRGERRCKHRFFAKKQIRKIILIFSGLAFTDPCPAEPRHP